LFGRSAHPLDAKVNIAEDVQKLVDLFVSYGHDKLDTSRIYGDETSEEVRMHCTVHCVRARAKLISQLDIEEVYCERRLSLREKHPW